MNIIKATDAYHITMGYLIGDDAMMRQETHILYARTGGPQVVPNLNEMVSDYLRWGVSVEDVIEGEEYWVSQGVPFATKGWMNVASRERMPVTVRGVRDGEVVLPGEPIAVIQAPAVMAAVPEPYSIGRMSKAAQVVTRFTKIAKAMNWDRRRVFEVGMRAAMSISDHNETVKILAGVGLGMTSSGIAAELAGIASGGSMGHRYTQRFTADYEAFNQAIDRMLAFRKERGIKGKVKVSFLLDTRDTMRSGLPAAIRVIEERWEEITRYIDLSVRLDSGDLAAQLREMIRVFKAKFEARGWLPAIIVESGLTPTDIAQFEVIAVEEAYPLEKMIYGVGGYLVGGISRDFVSMVYKASTYDDGIPTMKFGDEEDGAKESYPGNITLMEKGEGACIERKIALVEEVKKMEEQGWREIFGDIARDGVMVTSPPSKEEKIQRIEQQWDTVAQGYIGEEKRPEGFASRPVVTDAITRMIEQMRPEKAKRVA